MSIVRIQHDKDKPYVQINKIGLETPNVSWAAKGLWAYLISRPDNWRVSVAHLCKIYTGKKRGNSLEAIRGMIIELCQAGYMTRDTVREEKGKFEGINYVVYESKQVCEPQKELKKKVPQRVKPCAVEPALVKATLIKNEFIHSLDPEKKPEKTIEKTEAIRDRAQAPEVIRNSHFLDIREALEFCSALGVSIEEKDFKIWSSKFTAKEIYDALRLILDEQGEMSDGIVLKKPIKNHAAFVNSILHGGWVKERENAEANKKYAEEVKKNYSWGALKITKQYATCKKTGNDWSFKMSIEDFKREIDHHIHKTREAYFARKEKCYA
jgi:hypothetical protein